jgi:hypothetical protein
MTGENCDECKNQLMTGNNCDECKNSLMTGANCDECAEGFSGKNCEDCAEGYYGSSCTKCPVCDKDDKCHGTCKSGKTGEGLVCDWGYEISTGCTTCKSGFTLIAPEPEYPPTCLIPCNSDADCPPNVKCFMNDNPHYCMKYRE